MKPKTMKRDVKVLLITFGALLIFVAIIAWLCSRLFNLANIVSGG